MKNRFTSDEKGITLAVLVITIIIMLILSAVLLLSFDDVDVLNSTKDNIKTYKTDKESTEEDVEELVTNLDAQGRIEALSQGSINKITSKINDPTTTLNDLKVRYLPSEAKDADDNPLEITVEGDYNGGVDDQIFTQADLGARQLDWYVLSADANGLNLVSEPTKKQVQFKDSAGYDNCLYYLNELSTKFFTNVQDFGVSADRVHALRLTDIKKAAEQVNKGVKVTDRETGEERDWNWNLDFIRESPYNSSGTNAYNNGDVGQEKYTPGNKYYPALYKADSNKEVVANNPMYDELPGSKITTDDGIKRTLEDGSNPASKLTVNYTYVSYYNQRDTMLTNLGKFGSGQIAGELFEASGTNYWLASRCIGADLSRANYLLRKVSSGYIYYNTLCYSSGSVYEPSYAFRVVVSIPPSHFDVADDGTVTLK